MVENKREGLLSTHNLWSFWDNISKKGQEDIIGYYEAHPSMWDYKTLFYGEHNGSLEHGSIYCMDLLLVTDDLTLCDYFFSKFMEYNPDNYLKSSIWGESWRAQIDKIIESSKRVLLRRTDVIEIKCLKERIFRFSSLSINDIYWKDTHFFLQNYSKKVYRHYLNDRCSIERFTMAFNIDFNNLDNIQTSVFKLLQTNFGNGLLEQYLIHLEKQKEYKKCIDLIAKVKNRGWTNDFEKRLNRCISKLEKKSF